MLQDELISIIREKVADQLSSQTDRPQFGQGIFDDIDGAVGAAQEVHERLKVLDLEKREIIVANLREAFIKGSHQLAKLSIEETGMGRLADKIAKIVLAAKKTPGTEDLTPSAKTGDHGLTLVEQGPYGVIAAITPVTNPVATIINNAIGMISAGNAVVINPHPRAVRACRASVKLINDAIANVGGPGQLVCTVENPTMETAQELMHHPDVKMIVATGGPGVVKAALSSGKKAIGAGAGNPPVVVDETADIPKAAHDVVLGASFDNNLPCTSEKVAIVVEAIAREFIDHLKNEGAYILDDAQMRAVTEMIMSDGRIDKAFVGKDAGYILNRATGASNTDVRLLIVQVDRDHPLVWLEQLMPVLPLITVRDVDEAIDLAVKVEQGKRHTAVMHSKNVDHMTKYARAVETTIFVKNGPSYAGIGMGGEGSTTFTIAGPTGEGLTSAKTFTRQRRCVLVDGFRII